jgi:outer membrane protein TolC
MKESMRGRLAAFAAALLAACTVTVAAAGQGLTLSQLTAMAGQGNVELLKARDTLEEARRALEGESPLAGTRLTLGSSYGWAEGSTAAPGAAADASLTVPLAPQLSIGASVTTGGAGSTSLTLTPFAASTATWSQKEAWRKAALQVDSLSSRLASRVESAAWAVSAAQRTLAIAQSTEALEQERAEVARKSFDLGELSYTELQTARAAALTSRQTLFDAKRALLEARAALDRITGPAEGETVVRGLSLEELAGLAASRQAQVADLSPAQAGSLELRTLEIERDALREKLAATPLYTPDLSVAAHVSWPLAAGASLSFSISPADFKADERASIQRSILSREKELEIERKTAGLQAEVRREALAAAREVVEAREAEVGMAETSLAESRLLLSQGRATSLETRQAEIDLQSAEARQYSALVSLLEAQAAILSAADL